MKTFILCIEIFFARLLDVSIGSIRTVFLVRQKNVIASIFSFIEILIWLFVMKETLVSADSNIWLILSYALGYTFGTYVGGWINKNFIDRDLSVFIVTETNVNMVNNLKKNNFGVTAINLENNKELLLIEIKKKNLHKLKKLISKEDDKAFIIVNESINVLNGFIT